MVLHLFTRPLCIWISLWDCWEEKQLYELAAMNTSAQNPIYINREADTVGNSVKKYPINLELLCSYSFVL